MTNFKFKVATLLATGLLAACGGGGDGDQSPKVKFSTMVSFGDSLSDVGTYKVGTVLALGGGTYSVNSASSKNWTQIIATQLGVATPCAARTGLDGDALQGFSVAATTVAGCKNWAQGGSRITLPVGPGNKNLGGGNATLGQLTEPVSTQITNHLAGASANKFAGTELVTFMAGANDLFMQFGALGQLGTGTFAGYTQGFLGWTSTEVSNVNTALGSGAAAAIAVAGPIMVSKMTTAGTEAANLIKNQVLANGANYVVVINIPNVSRTPFGNSQAATGLQPLLDSLTKAYNAALAAGLSGSPKVKLVDAYTTNTDQIINPAQYGISNITTPACNLTQPSPNPLGSSLVCNAGNLISGDVSKYAFADDVHPTPYGYQLLAQLVAKDLVAAGWL